MPHLWRARAQSFKKLYLGSRICDVILTPDNGGDLMVNIINHRCHRIDNPAIFTHQHRV